MGCRTRPGGSFLSAAKLSGGINFYSFNADLTQRWSVPVPNVNIGAPAIGSDGTLVIAGIGTNIFAYRTPRSHCGSADFNCDGDVGTDQDIESFFACIAGSCPSAPCTSTADFNGDGDVGTDQDIEAFFHDRLAAEVVEQQTGPQATALGRCKH